MAYIASRGLGAVRQTLFNSLFGTGSAATAYYAAFRLPDTIFNLIAGGALAHAFIPVFLSREKERGDQEVWRLSSLVFNLLLVSLATVVLVAEFLAPAFVNDLLVPGLPAADRDLTTTLTRIMLIQPLILGLGTIATAILHSKRQFFPSAIAVAVYDLGPIAGLLLAKAVPSVGIYAPTYGLLASALLQVAVQIPNVLRLGVRYSFIWNLKYPGLHDILRLLGPNVLNVLVVSVGAIVVTSFASYLPDRASIAAMHNAFLLFSVPLTLVAQTIGNSLLPQLSIQAAFHRYMRMRSTVITIVGGALILSVTAAILLYFLGKPAIRLLFQYGAFSAHASILTNQALLGYALGLPGQTVSLLIVLCFYACKDAWTPLLINAGVLGMQIAFSLLLLNLLKGNSAILALPTASSLSATVQALTLCLILFVRLRAKVKTDKGMLRLQQRRRRGPIPRQPAAPVQAVPQHQPAWGSGSQATTMQHQSKVGYGSPASSQAVAQLEPETQPLLSKAPPMRPIALQETGLQPAVEQHAKLSDTLATASLQAVVTDQPLAMGDYQRLVLLAPGNLMARVRWHIAMITNPGTPLAASLGVLAQICRQLREGKQRNTEMVPIMYKQAAARYPENINVRFALGQIYQQSGKYAEAIDAYLLAMHERSVELIARYSSAQCLLAQDKPEAAIQQLEQALQIVRDNPGGAIDPAVWAARPSTEDDMHQAPDRELASLLAVAQECARQQELQTSLPQDISQLEETNEVQDEPLCTLTELVTSPKDAGDSMLAYIDRVHDYREKQQVEQTLDVLHEMVRKDPYHPWAHRELADIYMRDGLLSKAIAELAALTAIYLRNNQPQQASVMVQCIGNIHTEVGDFEEAFVYLRRALELLPDNPQLLSELVDCCIQLGRNKDAAEYQMLLTQHYLDTQELLELVNALQRLITIDRHSYAAYDLLGLAYQSVGDYEQALEVYEKLAVVQSENSAARERLAKLQELAAM